MEIPGHQGNEVSQGNNTNMDPDNDDTYVIKFRLSDIGRSALKKEERSELIEEIYQQVTDIVPEDGVRGLQLYPQKWPKTVHLILKNDCVKNQILVEGLNIFGKSINLQDDSHAAIIKVMVFDVPVDLKNERLKDIFNQFGDVVQVDDEKHVVKGRITSWDTGNKIVSMTTEQRTRSVSSGLSKQLGHMPRIRSKQSIHQMGRFAHLSVILLTQSFSLPLSPLRSDPPKEAVTNDQSRKGNLFDFFACRRS